jgi:hypothetical protein
MSAHLIPGVFITHFIAKQQHLYVQRNAEKWVKTIV